MAFIGYVKLWRSEFFNKVPARERTQGMNLNQLKVNITKSYKQDEELTTKFTPFIDEDVVIKTYLVEKLSTLNGHISFIKNDCKDSNVEFQKIHMAASHISDLQRSLIENAVKASLQKKV